MFVESDGKHGRARGPALACFGEDVFALVAERFVLRLNLNEFSILNVAEMDGLLKYGGSGEFMLNMACEGANEVVWAVAVGNPRRMRLFGIFLGEEIGNFLPAFPFLWQVGAHDSSPRCQWLCR